MQYCILSENSWIVLGNKIEEVYCFIYVGIRKIIVFESRVENGFKGMPFRKVEERHCAVIQKDIFVFLYSNLADV